MQRNSFELKLKWSAFACAMADKFGMKLTVAQLAEQIGAELVGDGCGQIIAVGAVETAGANDVTFITNDRHIARLKKSLAGAVIVSRHIEGLAKPQLIVKNTEAALIETLNIFAPKLKAPPEGIDPSAKVGQNVKIAKGVSVGAGVVIDNGVEIGENSRIASGCKIGENSKVGKNCRLDSNVVIYHNCTLGNNVIIQANSTIGSIGFGYSFIDGSHKLIPHNGGVVIEDFVEIGANCCVDRAKFGNTIIGAGTKIDNLVQIAHNVVIGKCCLIAGQVGISGSCKIGDGVVLAGQVGLVDNIEIGEGTMIGAQAGVMSGTTAGSKLLGSPAIDIKDAMKVFGLMKRLPELSESLKQLHKRIEKLEAAKDDKR
jgi:UDP-3-O-[3-hydroxymyristoyl] glucosamine N-acyltransferase